MSLDSLDELRTFLQVVDQRSFTAAARALSKTTNIVSRRVAQLEARLGVRLLHRTTRSVSLTEEGLRFAEASRRILEDVEVAESTLRRQADEPGGLVRVAVPTALVRFGLVTAIGTLLAQHESLGVQLLVADQPLDLVAHAIDVAVVDERASASNVVRTLGKFAPALAASPGYLATRAAPRRPQDLAAHECLRFLGRAPQLTWDLVDRRGVRLRAKVDGRFESNDSRALHDALYGGLGIGFCAQAELREAVGDGRLTRVLPGFTSAPMIIRAVVPARPGPLRARRVEAVVEVLRDSLGRLR